MLRLNAFGYNGGKNSKGIGMLYVLIFVIIMVFAVPGGYLMWLGRRRYEYRYEVENYNQKQVEQTQLIGMGITAIGFLLATALYWFA